MAERCALLYLRVRGLRLVTKNYRTRFGELDLVMLDRRCVLVVIEVRYRHSPCYGSPAETVSRDKRRRLVLAASQFLAQHRHYRNHRMRFDVVSMTTPNYLPQIEWIRDAFQPCTH
jgi:putative endonuclease